MKNNHIGEICTNKKTVGFEWYLKYVFSVFALRFFHSIEVTIIIVRDCILQPAIDTTICRYNQNALF